MGRLVYSVIASLDGYLADAEGRFDWAMPDEEVMAHVCDQEESVGTYLYGRRTYEMMTIWETDEEFPTTPGEVRFADLWRRADKVVHSTTDPTVTTRRTTVQTRFDADEVAALKRSSATDLNVFGPTLAAHAFDAGLVDAVQVTVVPHLVGSGLAWYPGGSAPLARRETRTFGSGAVWLRYDVG